MLIELSSTKTQSVLPATVQATVQQKYKLYITSYAIIVCRYSIYMIQICNFNSHLFYTHAFILHMCMHKLVLWLML